MSHKTPLTPCIAPGVGVGMSNTSHDCFSRIFAIYSTSVWKQCACFPGFVSPELPESNVLAEPSLKLAEYFTISLVGDAGEEL